MTPGEQVSAGRPVDAHRRGRGWWAVCLWIGAVALVPQWFLAGQITGAGIPTDPETIAAGRIIFESNCGNEFCHGPRGGGNFMGEENAQKLTDDAWFHIDGSYESIVRAVSEGIAGTPMEPWGGKMEQLKIRQVAAFAYYLSPKN